MIYYNYVKNKENTINNVEIYRSINVIKENDYKKISLVCSEIDNLYYVKRELKVYDKNLYLQLQEIKCKHLPKIYSVKEIDNTLIVIEEYINSNTLDRVIANRELEHEEIIEIVKQLCDCLNILHNLEKPIIHRDIKPENIFYIDERVVLFDFDISRNYSSDKTQDTKLLGSIGYASPEHFGFNQSDCRSDIYSLGVLLNVLLCNSLPSEKIFEGKEKKVILKATNIDPKNRYSNVNKFKNSLKSRYTLPGFRSNYLWKKIIGVCGYVFLIIPLCNFDKMSSINDFLYNFIYVAFFLFNVFLISNYMKIRSKILFHKSPNFIKRVLGIVLVYMGYLIVTAELAKIVKK